MLSQIMLHYKSSKSQGFSFMCKDIILQKLPELHAEKRSSFICQEFKADLSKDVYFSGGT